MPNWCMNEIEFSGPRDVMLRFLAKCGHERDNFSFEGIRPMPKELIGIINGFMTIEEVTYRNWREDNGKYIPIPEEELVALREKYTASDWYSWCCKNWGVKWDAHNVDWTYDDVNENRPYISASVCFDTPWGPPDALYTYIRKHYPDISWDWFFKEPGLRCAGWLGDEDCEEACKKDWHED